MHDDEAIERFLVENKPVPPAPPHDELRHLCARLAPPRTPPPTLLKRCRGAGAAAIFFSLALVLLVLLTRQPKPHQGAPVTADLEAVLSDSYGTLDDLTDEDNDDSGVFAWFEPGVSVD